MELLLHPSEYSICKLASADGIPRVHAPVFIAMTRDEISFVCRRRDLPEHLLQVSHGWRLLQIGGTLDFSMTGVISNISGALAEAGISIFVISTYNTDYFMVGEENVEMAILRLEGNRYHVRLVQEAEYEKGQY